MRRDQADMGGPSCWVQGGGVVGERGQKEKNRHTADICHSEDVEVKLTGV